MAPVDFFRKQGFWALEGFLDAQTCDALCAFARTAPALPADVVGAEGRFVDQRDRNTWEISSASPRVDDVAWRVADLQDTLAAHFDVTLDHCEGAKVLAYRTGGFYQPHVDRVSASGEAAALARARRISIVIFLNTTYAGGRLTFYNLMGDPQWRQYGFALDPAPGLLVAFRSEVVHEVTPVLSGERYTIVDWFGDA